jgi:tetratricopeptide (TPR) repeat protein
MTAAARRTELVALRRHVEQGGDTGVAGLPGSGRLALARAAFPDAPVIGADPAGVPASLGEPGTLIVDARAVATTEWAALRTAFRAQTHAPLIWILAGRPAELDWCVIVRGLDAGAARRVLVAEAQRHDPLFDVRHVSPALQTALFAASANLPGVLAAAARAVPSLGTQAVLRALSSLDTASSVLGLDWFIADIDRRIRGLDPELKRLAGACLVTDRPLAADVLVHIAGLDSSDALRLLRRWYDTGLLQPTSDAELCPPMPAPVRAALRHHPALQAEIAAATAGLYAAHTPRPDEVESPLSDDGWHDLLYAATHLRVPALLRWNLLHRLDDAARAPAQTAAMESLSTPAPENDAAGQLLLARRLRRSGQTDLSLAASGAALRSEALRPAALLEHGRTLYAAGRLQESAAMLRDLPEDVPPAWSCEAQRTRSAIGLAFDDVTEARSCAHASLALARQHGLIEAEARALGLLASIELADTQHEPALEHALQARALLRQRNDTVGEAAAALTLGSIYAALERHTDVTQTLADADGLLARQPHAGLQALAMSLRALSLMDQNLLGDARTQLEVAIAQVSERQPRMYAWLLAHLGALHALSGDREAAQLRMKDATARFARMGDLRNTLLFGHWCMLLGPLPDEALALMAGRRVGSAEILALQAVRSGAPPRTRASVWVRLASRIARHGTQPVIVLDGSWILTELGERIDLRRRAPARKVLAALVQAHQTKSPPMSTSELFAAAWPGDRSRLEAARARVYVAVNELRRSGLASVLRSDSSGYWLQGIGIAQSLAEADPLAERIG